MSASGGHPARPAGREGETVSAAGGRSATIEDVARAAGVSVATVSRALRGLPNVAPSTRLRVQSVAEELRYRADPAASRLAAGRTRSVAMAVPLLDSWYFSKVMAGAEAVLGDAGYDVLIFAIDSDDRRRRVLGGPLVKRVDGLILVDMRIPDDELAALRAVPLVSIGFEFEGSSSVMVDDPTLAHWAVTHLLDLGHRGIGLVGGLTDDPLRFAVPAQRQQGYRQALTDAGVALRPELEVHGNFSIEGGAEAAAMLLDLDDPPTAIFAMSDEMAFGVMREIWARGLEIPGDVSVVGVDDHDFASVVGLTTVHQQVAAHGAVAARLLLAQLDSSPPGSSPEPTVHVAESALVVRTSTGPPLYATRR